MAILCMCSWKSTCLECRMLQVRVPPETAHFSLKMTVLGDRVVSSPLSAAHMLLVVLYCVVLSWESLGLNISCDVFCVSLELQTSHCPISHDGQCSHEPRCTAAHTSECSSVCFSVLYTILEIFHFASSEELRRSTEVL